MLKIVLPAVEGWDEKTETFVDCIEECVLELEHSLVSISKWESKWHKPFLSSDKTDEETLDYIKCMTLTKDVSSDVYTRLTAENIQQVNEYIEDSMTATTFAKEQRNSSSREIVTAELIYYWMIALNIPIQFENWHLNRLLTQIRVCEIKSQPPKKMSKSETMRRNRALNEARRKRLNTKG